MTITRRKFLKVGGSTAALLATVACDQLPRELRALYQSPPNSGPFQPPAASEIDPVTHMLNRAAFGPRPGEHARVRKLGPTPEEAAAAFLDQQLTPEFSV